MTSRSAWASASRSPARCWATRGVLVLDEPTNGLDPAGIRWLRDLLRGFAGEGRTVLLSSHVLAEVAQTVDEVLILDRGRLRAHRRMADIESLEDDFLELTDHEEARS